MQRPFVIFSYRIHIGRRYTADMTTALPTSKPMRIPFDSMTLRAVFAEMRLRLIGAKIQDIRQPVPTELILGIRSHGQNYLLLLSCDAQFARLHLTSRKPKNAGTPPSFCMAVRKHLEGGILRDIHQHGFDRVAELDARPQKSAWPDPRLCRD